MNVERRLRKLEGPHLGETDWEPTPEQAQILDQLLEPAHLDELDMSGSGPIPLTLEQEKLFARAWALMREWGYRPGRGAA